MDDATMYSRSGDEFVKRMNWEEAKRAWQRALDDCRSTTNLNSRMEARLLNKIGIAYYIQDELYNSYECFEEALRIQETAMDPGDEEMAVTLKNVWIVRVRMRQEVEGSLTRELLMLHIMNNLLVKLLMDGK